MGLTYHDKITGEKTTSNREEAWADTQYLDVVIRNATITNLGSNSKAEMYIYENSSAATVDAVDQVHGALGHTAGVLQNWTFQAGATKSISAFADYSATVTGTIKATAATHTLSTGDIVCLTGANIVIGGANEYAGIYTITVIDADEFYFTNADWNATTTATVTRPDMIVAGADSGGVYEFSGGGSFTPAGNNKTYDFQAYLNTTPQPKIHARLTTRNATEYSQPSGRGILTITKGDVLWYGITGITDATNFTMYSANTILTRT